MGIQTINWGEFVADSAFAGLSPPGLVLPHTEQLGQIISTSGTVASSLTYTVVGQDGQPFIGYYVWVAVVEAGPGEVFCAPSLANLAYGPHPTLNYLYSVEPQPAYFAFYPKPTILSAYGAFTVQAQDAVAFRFFCRNNTDTPIIVTPRFAQG